MGSTLRAGVGRAVITPPIGVDLMGYSRRSQPSVGIHMDMYATALVALLRQGTPRLDRARVLSYRMPAFGVAVIAGRRLVIPGPSGRWGSSIFRSSSRLRPGVTVGPLFPSPASPFGVPLRIH